MTRLAAFDADDLTVISTLLQDAVLKAGDMAFDAQSGVFSAVVNRYRWEGDKRSRTGERLRSAVHFARVSSVRSQGLDRTKTDAVLSLLAIRFTPTDAPSGEVELVFSGGAALRLTVECLEAALSDGEAAWAAVARPKHDI
jgi:hypothetical protein